MGTFDIFELGLTILTIGFSAGLIIWQLKKNRDLETIKYLFAVRKEIWDLDEEIKLKKSSNVQVNQKLEYLATAVNTGVLDFKLVKKSCGRWFQSKVRHLGIIEGKKSKEHNKDSYEEIKKLYKKFNESYK